MVEIQDLNRMATPPSLTTCAFYADDGMIGVTNSETVSCLTYLSGKLFYRIGLRINLKKTKSMSTDLSRVGCGLSTTSYQHRCFPPSIVSTKHLTINTNINSITVSSFSNHCHFPHFSFYRLRFLTMASLYDPLA